MDDLCDVHYLYILDYADGELIEFALTHDQYVEYNENAEKLIDDIGLNEDECSWMWSDNPLAVHRQCFRDIIPDNRRVETLC